jgi:uncharacterized protein
VIVLVAEVRMRLYHAQTLKDKRQFLKSVLTRLPSRFGVAAAEIGHQDDPRTLEIGLAAVGNQKSHLEEVVRKAVHFAALNVDGEIYDVRVEER